MRHHSTAELRSAFKLTEPSASVSIKHISSIHFLLGITEMVPCNVLSRDFQLIDPGENDISMKVFNMGPKQC